MRPFRLLTTLTTLALVSRTPALAQVDIESLRADDAPPGVSGSVSGDLDVTTGNTDFVELGVEGRLNWARGQATTLAIADGGLGFLGGDRFASSGLLHLRRTHWLAEWVAVEGYGQLNYDRPLRLDFRALAGAGVRLQLTGGEWGALGLGHSLMLEREDLDLPATAMHDARTETLRNSTFVTVRLVGGDGLVVSSTAYLQPALSDLVDDVRVIENLRLAASLTDRLALTISFDLRHDSEPPDGIEGLDTKLTTGVTFTY